MAATPAFAGWPRLTLKSGSRRAVERENVLPLSPMNQPEPGPDAPASVDPALPPPERPACALVPKGRWKGYKLDGPFGSEAETCFEAVRLDNMEPVLIRAEPVVEATEWRRGAWQRLAEQEDLAIVGPIEAVEEEGWRYEVTRRPPATTLLDWFSCHKAGYESVEALVRQLAAVLETLHAQGVVHRNLRPETIYVDAEDDTLRVVVGGLQGATLYTQSTIELKAVDPFYAPPEAAGRRELPPGTGLCAWDWWSVGRIVQQFLLGRHVAVLLKPEAARDAAALAKAAEQLLLEREPPGMRAGAVEAMGPIDPVIKTLLQGLLTSARDARWSGPETRRWLARETVRVHYELPTGARLFVWKGRGLTLAAAAEFFAGEEPWDDGEFNLFSSDEPASFLAFLRAESSLAATLALVEKHLEWIDRPEWSDVPPVVRRTIVAGVVWLALAQSQGQRAALALRGRRVDAEGLAALFECVGSSAAVALARGLVEPSFVDRLAPLDPEAATTLSGLAALGEEARRQAVGGGWIDAEDEEAHARILHLALELPPARSARIEKLRAQYATCRSPELAAWLVDRDAPDWATVLLAYTGERAAHFGYVTHGAWKRERLAELDERARRVRTAIFWRRLQDTLRLGVVAGAPWVVIGLLVAVLLGTGGLLAGRPGLALAAAGALGAGRWWLPVLVSRWVRRHDPDAAPWSRRDGWRRCREEAERLVPGAPTVSALEDELSAVGQARENLAPSTGPAVAVPDFGPLRAGLVAATFSLAVLAGHFVHTGAPRLAALVRERNVPSPSEPVAATAAAYDDAAARVDAEAEAVASGKFEYVDDGFGRRLRGPLERWAFHAPAAPVEPLPVERVRPASAWQRAHARVSLELLLLPYVRDSVHALVAVRVPSADGGTELMILNGRSRRPFADDALRLTRDLDAQTWYEHGRRRVIYLGEPPSLAGEFSLAPE